MVDTSKQPTVFDTDQQLLGDVYAKALIGFGVESGSTDQIVDQLSAVVEVLSDLPQLRAVLESPRVSLDAKSGLLDSAFSSRVSRDVLNFLKIVASKNRFDCLGAMEASACRMQDEMAGRVQATLTTAEAVDDAVRKSVSERLAEVLGKQVSLTSMVDPTIIGGMVVRVGDTVYDGSVANELAQVRTKAAKRAVDAIREHLDRFMNAS